MCNKSNNYSFGQRLLLDIVPNLKWPIAIFVIWTLLPADFGGSFSKFAKDNNLKKVGFRNTVLEMDPNQKIEQIKKANEKVNLTESVSETFKSLSKTSDEDLKKKLSKFEKAINSLQEQSSKILNETTKIFVQNYNLNLEFNKNKKVASILKYMQRVTLL
jgi:esterase/lipase